MLKDGPFLDRQYTAFGKVISGMEYVDRIKTGKGKNGAVSNPDRIISMKMLSDDIAEKPKKKKPKQLPEDNKVVPAGSGSGFLVSRDGHIITNHHVIDGCNTTKVSFQGNQVDAQILAVDKMNDIAILKTNIKPNSIFPISNEDVSLLEDVVVAGYPLGKQVSSAIKTHKGVVTALAGAGDNYSNFQTDASINAGNSGGPIMNQKGNIVGIAVATWVQDGVQGVHFGIKSSTLKTFANSNSLKFSQANNRELSNKDLGKLITEATVYLECHMTVANIKKMMAAANNRKAFFSEFK
jgi:S1-C subfamily serine protease